MIEIVEMTESLLPEILKIEMAAFSPPWTEGALLSEIGCGDAFFAAAVEKKSVIGFCVFRRAADEGELYQIAVAEDARRRGAADRLMAAALDYAVRNRVASVYLEVRKSNEPALALYKKHGFSPIGIRKRYYVKPEEDAVVMRLHTGGEEEKTTL